MCYSSIKKRFLAMVIDIPICSILGGVTVFLFGGGWSSQLAAYMLCIGYYVLCESSKHHATIGKHIMGIMIVDKSGNGINHTTSIIRYLCKMISGFTFGLGTVYALFNKEHRTLYDKMAGTYVVDVKSKSDKANRKTESDETNPVYESENAA